jgi:hypothetical protein
MLPPGARQNPASCQEASPRLMICSTTPRRFPGRFSGRFARYAPFRALVPGPPPVLSRAFPVLSRRYAPTGFPGPVPGLPGSFRVVTGPTLRARGFPRPFPGPPRVLSRR